MIDLEAASAATKALKRHERDRTRALDTMLKNFHERWDRKRAAMLSGLNDETRAAVEEHVAAEAKRMTGAGRAG